MDDRPEDVLREVDRALTVANACLQTAHENILIARETKFFADDVYENAIHGVLFTIARTNKIVGELYKPVSAKKKLLELTKESDDE